MIRNTIDVDIPKPVDEVFQYVEDDSKMRQWIGGILESSRAPGPARPGTTFRQVVDVNGKPLELQGELTKYVPNRELGVRLRSEAADMDVTYQFEPRGSSTRIHYVCDSYYHKWLYRLIGPILKRVSQKKLASDFNRLRDLLAAEPASGAREPERRAAP